MCENAFVELSGFKNPQFGDRELRNPGSYPVGSGTWMPIPDQDPDCPGKRQLSCSFCRCSVQQSPLFSFSNLYLFIWLFLFLRISRLNWTVLNLQLYKYFFLWSSSLRNRNRNMHMEARKYVWEGAIPLQIHLHESEVTTLPPPPPALVISPLNLFLFNLLEFIYLFLIILFNLRYWRQELATFRC